MDHQMGAICVICDLPIFDGCEHYHGEWQCDDCGEWTYPFYYEISEGCQYCGSSNVKALDLEPGKELERANTD